MSLKMSKQATLELLNSNAAKYRKAYSRKAKGELLKQLMELTGYNSSKSIIRYYSRTSHDSYIVASVHQKQGKVRLAYVQPCHLHPNSSDELRRFMDLGESVV